MICADTKPDDDNWSRCNDADYAVQDALGCGWRIVAHKNSYYNLHICEHPWRSPLVRSDNSRYAEYAQARAVFDVMQDLFYCLWGIRLANWDDPGHHIEHAFEPVWNHCLAAYDAAKRTLQVEDAFYWRQCTPDPYGVECLEVM